MFGVVGSRTIVMFLGSFIVATAVSNTLGTFIEGAQGLATAASIMGVAALLVAVASRDLGYWGWTPPILESPTEDPPSPS